MAAPKKIAIMNELEEEPQEMGEKSKEKGRLVVRESILLREPPTDQCWLTEHRLVHLVVAGAPEGSKPIPCDLDRLLEKSSLIREMYDICKSPGAKDEIEQLPITGPMSYQTMQWVVKYVHCLADVHITKEENYKDLMTAADYMGIESLSNQCRKFIVDRLKLNNCVDRWTFLCTKLGLDQLRKHTEDYMSAVFFELMESVFSRDVTENLLLNLLQRNDLRVKSENELFTFVADWAEQPERDLTSGAIFGLIQYHLLNEKQLKEASDKLDCIQSLTGVDFSDVKEQLIRPAMEYACLRYEDKLSYWSHKEKPGRWPKIIVTKLDKSKEVIGHVDVGGKDFRDNLLSLKGYDFESDTWFVLERMRDGGQLNHLQKYTGCCSSGSNIYWIGGVKTPWQEGQTEASQKYVHSYDVESGVMFTESALLEGRKMPSVTAHKGKIYIFGGLKVEYRRHMPGAAFQQAAAAAEVMHIGLGGLHPPGGPGPAPGVHIQIHGAHIQLHGHGAHGVHFQRIMEQPETPLVSAEVYTPGEGSRALPNLPEEFNNGLGIATHNQEIYLQFSNGSGSQHCNPVYTFDPQSGRYTEGKPLPEKRHRPAIESMNKKLYLFGGIPESDLQVELSLNYQAMVKDSANADWVDANIFDDHYRAGCKTVNYQGTFYCLGGRMKKYASLQTAGARCTPCKSNLWREWPVPEGLLPSKCESSPGDYPHIHMVLVDKPIRFMHRDLPDPLYCDKVPEVVNMTYDSDVDDNEEIDKHSSKYTNKQIDNSNPSPGGSGESSGSDPNSHKKTEAEMRFLKNLCLKFDLQFTGVSSGHMFDPDPAKDQYLIEILFQIFKLAPETPSSHRGRLMRPLSFAFRFIYQKKFNLSLEEVLIGYLMLIRTPYFSAMRSIYKTHSSVFSWSRTDQGLLYLTLPSSLTGHDLHDLTPMYSFPTPSTSRRKCPNVSPELEQQLDKKADQVEAANVWIIRQVANLYQKNQYGGHNFELVLLNGQPQASDASQVFHPEHIQHVLDQQPGFNVAAATAASTQVTAEDSREYILNNRSLVWKLSTTVWNSSILIGEAFNRFQIFLKIFMLQRLQNKILRRGGQPLEAPEPNPQPPPVEPQPPQLPHPQHPHPQLPPPHLLPPQMDHDYPFFQLGPHFQQPAPHVPQEIEFGPLAFDDYDSEDEEFLFEAFSTEEAEIDDGSGGGKSEEEPLWKFSLLPGELEVVQEIYHALIIDRSEPSTRY